MTFGMTSTVLMCISANYDGFTAGNRYAVVGSWDEFPLVIDDWHERTAAGGLNGIFINIGHAAGTV